ncbi:hypothetical protein P4B35_06605 [Pontiellaceae bacterium B12227]|nr:hypothetical protein [Pontiellaceae bacterium B12227]
MKNLFLLIGLSLAASALAFRPDHEFAGPVGTSNSTAIHMTNELFVAWADGYADVNYGADVVDKWKTPIKGLGPAVGGSMDIVCLGRGGDITLTFSQGISDGPGADFAVFENSFSAYYLELAYVEVSSDGIHFVRFPGFSYTAAGSGGFIYAQDVHGLASKYAQSYGTPFDLYDLQLVADAILTGSHTLSADYVSAFEANFQSLDLSSIGYVRLVDIIGDGTSRDAEGFAIYDPIASAGAPGFDLDAIGVLNAPPLDGLGQTIAFDPIPHQKLSFQSLELSAEADSGLPVLFAVQSGPATNQGSRLFFTGTGVVEVVASQSGNETYAAASPALRSFNVAEQLQHIFVESVANQIAGNHTVQVKAYSSRGLPVQMEVQRGPDGVVIDSALQLTLTNEAGSVTLHAFQSGDAVTAPAEDVYVNFEITEVGATNQPVLFAEWLASNTVPNPVIQSSEDLYGRPAVTLDYEIDPQVLMRSRVLRSSDLVSWTHAVPEVLEMSAGKLVVQLAAEDTNCFYRLEFEGQ